MSEYYGFLDGHDLFDFDSASGNYFSEYGDLSSFLIDTNASFSELQAISEPLAQPSNTDQHAHQLESAPGQDAVESLLQAVYDPLVQAADEQDPHQLESPPSQSAVAPPVKCSTPTNEIVFATPPKKNKAKKASAGTSGSSDTASPPRKKKNEPIIPAIGANGLRFSSVGQAEAIASFRTMLDVDQDDWAAMEATPEPHIKNIMTAFSATLASTPQDRQVPAADLPRWCKYQNDHSDKVTKILARDTTPLEVSAWLVFGAVIDAHKNGVKNVKSSITAKNCSAHLEECLEAVRDYGVVRFDILRYERIDELVTDKLGLVKRKLQNFMTNVGKQKRDEENARRAAETGLEYQAVLGNKKGKRKADDDGEDECEGASKRKRGKKAVAIPAAGEVNVGGLAPPSFQADRFGPAVAGAQSTDLLSIVGVGFAGDGSQQGKASAILIE